MQVEVPQPAARQQSALPGPPALQLRDVHIRFPGAPVTVLRIADFAVAPGAHVLIHGPSGRGKTTLLHLLAGLLVPAAGQILVGDLDLRTASEAERSRLRRREFGVVFQTLNLLDHLTPLENVELAVGGGAAARARAKAALAAVHMLDRQHAATVTLSFGQRQRVAVARVLAARPRIILADEPTSSLDAVNAAAIADALFTAAAAATLVVVSHDLRIRERFARVLGIDEVVAP